MSRAEQVLRQCGVSMDDPDFDAERLESLLGLLSIYGNVMIEAAALLVEQSGVLATRSVMAKRIRALKDEKGLR